MGLLIYCFLPLLLYSLACIFTSRSINLKVRFFSPFFPILYLPSLCLFSHRFFSSVFHFSCFTSPSLVINNNHLERLTAEGNPLSSYMKQNTDLSARTHIKCNLAQVRNGHKFQLFLLYQIMTIIIRVHSCLICLFSFTFQQIFRGKTVSSSTEPYFSWVYRKTEHLKKPRQKSHIFLLKY